MYATSIHGEVEHEVAALEEDSHSATGQRSRTGAPARTSRGPAHTYSREQIAWAAIGIADEHGIEAVSMRRVAAALGTGAMSLYRYVANKDALFEAMLDAIIGDPTEWEGRQTGDWRDGLRAVARGSRATQLQHPWMPRLLVGRPAITPATLSMIEYGMSILDGLGLDVDEMMETIGLVTAWVAGFVQGEVVEREAADDPAARIDWEQSRGPQAEALLATGRYPYFARIVRESQRHDPDARFERALDRIIAGVEAMLPRDRA